MQYVELIQIPVTEILPHTKLVYGDELSSAEYSLFQSMKKTGIHIPILVRYYRRQYKVVDGDFRLWVGKKCGHTMIRAVVTQCTMKEARWIQTELLEFQHK